MTELRQVHLPEDLCEAAEKKYGSRFRSIDELVCFLVRELLRSDTLEIDRAEQAAVEQRLKDLGYL
jgi:Arc/MetJ-type ribon-helix-helix transcriptional regulator